MKTFVNQSNDPSSGNSFQGPGIDFRQLMEASPIAFYTTDVEGRLSFYNKAAEELWGRTPELGSDLWCGSWKVFFPDGRPMAVEEFPIVQTLKTKTAQDGRRISIERPDETIKNLLVFPQPIFDADGKLTGAHNTLVDITEQQNSEIKRVTLSAIVESSDDAIISKSLDGIITSWNSGAERIFKYTEDEILGKNIKLLIPESRQDDEDLILETILKGGRVDHFETIRQDKYGNEIPLSLTVSPVKDIRGNIIGASKVARDISDRIHREERQAVLSAIVESSDDAIISKDLNGVIMSWNRGAEQIFGYKENEVQGKSITILIPRERLPEESLILRKIRRGEKVQHFETRRLHKDGHQIDISITVSPIKDSQGRIIGASKIARDISKQIQAQEQIKKHSRNLEILNGLGKSISKKMDVQGILQQVTDATTKLTGAGFGIFFYNNVNEDGEEQMLFTASGVDKARLENDPALLRSVQVLSPAIMRIENITKDSRYNRENSFFVIPGDHPKVRSYLSVPVISSSGSVIGGLIYGHQDVGAFKQEHEDLVSNIAVQAAISLDNSVLFEQVKTLSDKKDEFIAVASHELKTPLTTIKGYLQVLAKNENDKMSSLFISKSLNQVNKLNTLVEDLLNMSRLESGKLDFSIEQFDIRKALLEMTETFNYTYKSHQLLFDLGDEPVILEADRQRIEQAVINLLTNAVKYSPKANKIYLKLTCDRGKACISVRDEGMGLTPQQMNKIFSRYYRAKTTKGISGLGLGLYLTKEIIDRHQGKIEVRSKAKEGSEFRIFLPTAKTLEAARSKV